MKQAIIDAIENAAKYFELYPDDMDTEGFASIQLWHYSESPSYGISELDTTQLTKRGYRRFEGLADVTRVYQGFTLSFSYDVSGYSYWTKDMQESNYIYANVEITSEDEVNPAHMENAMIDFICTFMRGYEAIYNNKSNIRKSYQA